MNAFFADYTQNISKGGTFIKTTTPLPLETELVFSLRLPEQSEPLRVRGRVVRVLGPENPEPGMGIRFIYDTDTEQQQFEGAVEQLIKASLGEQAYAYLSRKKA
jgi:type IV pilus assembly protein PilZ